MACVRTLTIKRKMMEQIHLTSLLDFPPGRDQQGNDNLTQRFRKIEMRH